MSKILPLLFLSTLIFAAGYKVPEQSFRSTALSAAYIANANGADASYYNPANMPFFSGGAKLEVGLSSIYLSSIKYSGTTHVNGVDIPTDGYDSKSENFVIPIFHYVSKDMGRWRYGISFSVPAGLSKRWDERYSRAFAEEFTLETVELNPSIGYLVSENFAFAFGARAVHSKGVVKSKLDNILTRDMSGDSIDFGYNLALSYRPNNMVTAALTYRSKVDLSLEGDARLFYVGGESYNSGATLEIPIPQTWSAAISYKLNSLVVVEFVFERTLWSDYNSLDFNYESLLGPVLASKFDVPITKEWHDSNSYRFGLAYDYSDRWNLMAGFAYDETPMPKSRATYDLPDSDAKIYSLGLEYKYSHNTKVGTSILFSDKESLSLDKSGNDKNLNGVFKDASATMVSIGVEYSF